MSLTFLLALALGYLAGSIPFGVLITRAMGLGDLRSIGSGNIGATNVLRTGNKPAALVAALGAFLGHLFPVWLGFRGGKGVATFLGIMLALAWPAGIAACLTWLAVAAAFRYSSLAALVAAAAAPLWLAVFGRSDAIWLAVALALLVFVRHHANIRRLLAGTEPRIGKGK